MDDSSDRGNHRRLGEVIETSTIRIMTESDVLNDLPRLGSVVRTTTADGDDVFAVVSYCETVGIDSTRRAVRRGSDDVRDAEVYRQHPELTQVLRSTFEAVPIAFRHGSTIRWTVPPLPPPLHYSVQVTCGDLLVALTDKLDYLSMLARHSGPVTADQIVIAHVTAVFELRERDFDWLERAASEVGRIYAREYDLLLPVLQAIDPRR